MVRRLLLSLTESVEADSPNSIPSPAPATAAETRVARVTFGPSW